MIKKTLTLLLVAFATITNAQNTLDVIVLKIKKYEFSIQNFHFGQVIKFAYDSEE